MMVIVPVVLFALAGAALVFAFKRFSRRTPAKAADKITSMP